MEMIFETEISEIKILLTKVKIIEKWPISVDRNNYITSPSSSFKFDVFAIAGWSFGS